MDSTSLPRVAWFTPLPPTRSGISRYSAEVVPGLSRWFEIDLFVEGRPATPELPGSTVPIRSAHDFVWMHVRRPYDLVVYQLGNAICHDYMWGYLARYPGLVVLHDGQLHYARGRQLRDQGRYDDYLAEFQCNHPGVDVAVAEQGIRGRLDTLAFHWPMRRVVVETARLVAVHNQWLVDELTALHPDARVERIDMGVPPSAPHTDGAATVRARHAVPSDATLFVALGEITPEKRIPEAIRQLAAIVSTGVHAHLLLAGSPVSHYDARANAQQLGVDEHVAIAGYVPHGEIDDYLAAADVCLCLRWPTSRETSAAWLRCLAAGRPTIVTDLAQTTDIPAYDPRSWTPTHAPARRHDALGWPVRDEPACVALDIMDEEHSLRLAMQRLATEPLLRTRLGHEARALWSARFSLDDMVSAYRRLIAEAMAQPVGSAPAAWLPAHFHADGTQFTAARLRELGLTESQIDALWTARAARP